MCVDKTKNDCFNLDKDRINCRDVVLACILFCDCSPKHFLLKLCFYFSALYCAEVFLNTGNCQLESQKHINVAIPTNQTEANKCHRTLNPTLSPLFFSYFTHSSPSSFVCLTVSILSFPSPCLWLPLSSKYGHTLAAAL